MPPENGQKQSEDQKRASQERASVPPNPESWKTFVRATGGGLGSYVADAKKGGKFFNQISKCTSHQGFGLGFGRIRFHKDNGLKPYVRVPSNTDEHKMLYFIENVWGLPRPSLLFSITGSGVGDMPLDDELQNVLVDLICFAGQSNSWITTGGWDGVIMRLLGDLLPFPLKCALPST